MKADLSVEDGHLCNMGKMIEELEGKLRNQLDQVWFVHYMLEAAISLFIYTDVAICSRYTLGKRRRWYAPCVPLPSCCPWPCLRPESRSQFVIKLSYFLCCV